MDELYYNILAPPPVFEGIPKTSTPMIRCSVHPQANLSNLCLGCNLAVLV